MRNKRRYIIIALASLGWMLFRGVLVAGEPLVSNILKANAEIQMPQPLQVGDKVMIITPSWKVEGDEVEAIKKTVTSWGLVPVCGEFCMAQDGIMGGAIWQRFSDLRKAMTDPSIKAIWCSRGGYGIVQMLDSIDSRWIVNNPKWVIGYSDITLLHALFSKNRVGSVHGVMGKQISQVKGESESLNALHKILTGERVVYSLPGDVLNRAGKATGEVYGGNLTILYSRRSTPLDFDPRGKILFIEDIGERPFEVERVMYNLKHSGVLAGISGLIVGRFTYHQQGVSPEKIERDIYQVISNLVAEYDYPVCFNFPVGHVGDNLPVLVGSHAQFSVERGSVSLIMNPKAPLATLQGNKIKHQAPSVTIPATIRR